MSNHILLERDGPVATLVLNRPDKLNAFTDEMLVAATEQLRRCDDDPDVRVVVIRGEGERAFCTGADLAELAERGPFEIRESNRLWIDLFHAIESIRQPVVASVHGHCIAGGTELTLCCDLVVASDDASFGLVEARVGVLPGAGASIRITRWVGRPIAKEILMLGDPWPAAEAYRVGLVNRIVPRAQLRQATRELVQQLAARSPLALAAAKRAVNIGSEMDLDRGIEYVLAEFALLFAGGDQKEGMRAFLDKRQPDFPGR